MPALIFRDRAAGTTKYLLARTLRAGGRAIRKAPAAGWRILLYHAVTPGPVEDRWGRAVSIEQFERQLDWLAAQAYTVLSVAQAKAAPSPRMVSLTFDDGYAGTAELAAGALARHGWAGTIFVTTDWVGRDGGHLLERFVSWPQLAELVRAGWEIGSHGCTHRRLTGLAEPDARRELAESKARLESELRCPVAGFSFPHGERDPRHAGWLAGTGYRYACTSRTGMNLGRADPFALRRLEVPSWDSLEAFELKMQGYYDWVGVLRR